MSLFLFVWFCLDFTYDKDIKVIFCAVSYALSILLTAEYSIYGHAMIYFKSGKLIAIFVIIIFVKAINSMMTD